MILKAFLLKSDPKHGRVGVEHCYTSALELELWMSRAAGPGWLLKLEGEILFKKLSMEIGKGGKREPPDSLHLPLLSWREQEYETNGHYSVVAEQGVTATDHLLPPFWTSLWSLTTHSWLSYGNRGWGLASFGWLVFSFRCLFHAFIASVICDFPTTASEQMAAPAPTAHRWWTQLPPWLAGTPLIGGRLRMLLCDTYFQLRELGRTRKN